MSCGDRTTALVDRLADAARAAAASDSAAATGGGGPRIVEVGVGERVEVAASLAARGFAVTATDVVERSVPDGVAFVRDDVTAPDAAAYDGAALVYALRLPPELHGAVAAVARDAGARAAFTTLGGDPPAVEATPEQLPGGETVFWVGERR